MKFLAVDDEKIALNALESAIHKTCADAEVCCFQSAQEALQCASHTRFDADFLDISMRETSGLTLARALKELQADSNIIFVTGYSDYALDAMELFSSGYLLKPVTPEKIRLALDNLRHPVTLPATGKLVIRCFGNFEVFVNGTPLPFTRHKSKELLAYLVDRCGAGCTMEEIAAVLWDDGQFDRSRRNQLHSYLSDLGKTLEQAGVNDLLIRQHNSYAVDTRKVDCDYYRCLGNDPAAINAYLGEYMAQYSWAEWTTGALTQKLL